MTTQGDRHQEVENIQYFGLGHTIWQVKRTQERSCQFAEARRQIERRKKDKRIKIRKL